MWTVYNLRDDIFTRGNCLYASCCIGSDVQIFMKPINTPLSEGIHRCHCSASIEWWDEKECLFPRPHLPTILYPRKMRHFIYEQGHKTRKPRKKGIHGKCFLTNSKIYLKKVFAFVSSPLTGPVCIVNSKRFIRLLPISLILTRAVLCSAGARCLLFLCYFYLSVVLSAFCSPLIGTGPQAFKLSGTVGPYCGSIKRTY